MELKELLHQELAGAEHRLVNDVDGLDDVLRSNIRNKAYYHRIKKIIKGPLAGKIYEAKLTTSQDQRMAIIDSVRKDFEAEGREVEILDALIFALDMDKTAEWECTCHQINNDNFCIKCGKEKNESISQIGNLWTCDCGNENFGNYCTRCGEEREDI